MNSFINNYFSKFIDTLNSIEITDQDNNPLSLEKSIETILNKIGNLPDKGGKIMMVGNGGSAGICAHQTTDYLKNGKIKSMNFNDPSLLTCLSNDFSFSEVFSKPIEIFSERDDIVYCFSSSGNSENILNSAKAAKERGCFVITFSGFDPDNKLKKLGDVNYYLKSHSYGHVEIIHLYISHLILDSKLFLNDKIDVFNKNFNL